MRVPLSPTPSYSTSPTTQTGSSAHSSRKTVLSEETKTNMPYGLVNDHDTCGVCTFDQVDKFVNRYLASASRSQPDRLREVSLTEYFEKPYEDYQVSSKGGAKAFLRSYHFLTVVLSCGSSE